LDLNDEVASVKTVEKSKFDIQGEENMIIKKRQWGKDIPIYRLCNGKFVTKDYDEEEQKAQELEE